MRNNEQRNALFDKNINLAHKFANMYYVRFRTCIEFEDLRQIAYIGLLKACDTF